MSVDEAQTSTPRPTPETNTLFGDDRHCRACHEVALAFDPVTNRPRCYACGELA